MKYVPLLYHICVKLTAHCRIQLLCPEPKLNEAGIFLSPDLTSPWSQAQNKLKKAPWTLSVFNLHCPGFCSVWPCLPPGMVFQNRRKVNPNTYTFYKDSPLFNHP